MSRAVDFNNNNLQYRFIDLDLSVVITLEDSDFLFIPGFQATDSKARLNVPRDLFSKLFYYSVNYPDLLRSDYTKIKYAMDSSGWFDASYSNAIVDASDQIITSSIYQNVKYDYIRFILKEITGTNSTNGLFRNTDRLLQNVVSFDSAFNSQIISILGTCGTVQSPKLNDSFYNNPGNVLIQSILANDNVIETDNEARRSSLVSSMTTNTTTFYNNSTSYYLVGTKTGETLQYCYFPIYLIPSKGSAITFIEYPDYTFYETALTTQKYTNIDTIFIAYQIHGTKVGSSYLYYYPIYLTNADGRQLIQFSDTELAGITFYTTNTTGHASASVTYPDYSAMLTTNALTPYYVNGTRTNDTYKQMYFPIYVKNPLLNGVTVTFTDASYAGYPLYTVSNEFGTSTLYTTITSNTDVFSIYATYLNCPTQYFTVYLNSATGRRAIQFTDASYVDMTFYTTDVQYDVAYSLRGTVLNGELKYYYPIYLTNKTGRTPIQFTDIDPTLTFYTTDTLAKDIQDNSYINYNTLSTGVPYFIYGTKTGTNIQQYYSVSLTTGIPITFVEYPLRTFFTNDINNYTYYNTATPNSTTPYFYYGTRNSNTGYHYPLYTINAPPHTFTISFSGVTLYSSTGSPSFIKRYEDFATNYTPTTAYSIQGTKTGTLSPYYYFPIYVYPGHLCTTPITFDNYPGITFYTNYDQINNQFYNFGFEYGDSLSVRVTYKPKYNSYMGKDVRDYSYEVYLDMGLENVFQTPYTALGDENTDSDVAQMSYAGTKIYTALGVGKSVIQYVLKNTILPSLYASPYSFYPTLNDISNVSFDMLNPTSSASKWYFSIFCRPRASGPNWNDAIGFDRFNTENTISSVNTWTSFSLSNLTWTNGTKTGLTWANILDLIIVPATTPYGYIKTNGQQQIMVMSINTDNTSYKGSICNVSVMFKDGRQVIMT